ncbi:MAG: alpha/beta hydrolase [Steroidobacteraceae bacterium]
MNAPSTRPRRGYADGPYGQVHYHDTGSGVPLVLIHQAPVSARQYDAVYPRLAALGVRAIGMDMPGFGMSDPAPVVPPRVEDFARVVPALLDHLGLAQAAVLGHHTGALVATEVALQFPKRVERLILNGPLPLEDAEREQWMNFVRNEEMTFSAKPDGSHIAKLYQVRWGLAGGTVPGETVTRYISETLMGFAPFWYGHNAAFVYDHTPALKKLKHRTLILTNTGDQIYAHAQVARRMRPDFEYAELQGGGIDVTDQLPDAWAQAVARFVKAA